MGEVTLGEIVVSTGEERDTFPLHDYVVGEVEFTRGKALTFTQVDNRVIKDLRKRERENSKARFQWIPRKCEGEVGWGLPRYVDTDKFPALPTVFHWTNKRLFNLLETGIATVVAEFFRSIPYIIGFKKLNDLESFADLYRGFWSRGDPSFIARWKTDEEFGRQQLMGLSPTSLRRCQELPEGCQITHSHVSEVLSDGVNLEQEIADSGGRIFIGDYSQVFQGVIRNKNKKGEQLYCPDAIGLFYVNDENNLVPIAIQLIPNEEETIFTPKDSPEDWMLAKMYYRTAAANLHEWYYHFMLTHGVMEPFSVALFRCLPRSHPIYKLLRPHLQTVSAINAAARKFLLGAGSFGNKALAIDGDDLAIHCFRTFQVDDLDIPEVVKKRGLDDKKLFPQNFCRDDLLELWEIIEKFVSNVIRHYYSGDEDVANDEELQEYVRDVAEEGLGWHDGNTRGMPSSILTIEDLISLCIRVIYTSSVNHAAVNFPQYEFYKFVPNSPTAMRLAPHRRGEATMKRIMDSLPDIDMSKTTIALAYVLSSISPDEVFLGEYPMKLFTEPEVLRIIEDFQEGLKTFSENVKRRNKHAGENAYAWLLPESAECRIASLSEKTSMSSE